MSLNTCGAALLILSLPVIITVPRQDFSSLL